MEKNEDRPPSRRCIATVKDGKPCRAFALHGEDYCLFHSSSGARQRIHKPDMMDHEEMIRILTRSIRKLGGMRGPGALDRAKEIRSLAAMIEELKSGKAVETKEVTSTTPSGIADRVEKWKTKNRQS